MQWKVIPGFPDYEVREDGVVRRITPDQRGRFAGRVIKPYRLNTAMGYWVVRIRKPSGRRYGFCVHQVVCRTFIGRSPTSKHEVAHNDGNHDNNHFLNLRWATRQDNIADRSLHGTNPVGTRNAQAKLTDVLVFEIRDKIESGVPYSQLMREYHVSRNAISLIKLRRTWRHL